MKKQSFFNGALILMFAGLIVKIMGFFYRIYLSNLLGAEGMGVFQLIMPVYSLVIITLTSGISIAVSSMAAEEFAKKNFQNSRKITNISLWIVFIISIIVTIFLYIILEDMVKYFLKDNRTYLSLCIFIPSIPIITLSSAIKGYFYALSNVVPTAIAQIAEQTVRIGSVIFLINKFSFLSISYSCALVMLGMILSEIANLLVLVFEYNKKKYNINGNIKSIKKRRIIKDILNFSFSIAFNRLITSIMSAIEIIFIPSMLISYGLSYQESMVLFGKLTGMAMPLILFPSIVTNSLATTLVPAIAEGMATKNYKKVNYRMSKSIQVTFILGFIFSVTFMTFPQNIGKFIYRKQDITDILYYLSFSCGVLYLQQIILGILNGLGEQTISLVNSIIGYGIRIIFVFFVIPIYGIKGYIVGIIVSSMIVCMLNLAVVIKNTGMVIDLRNWILKPFMVSVFMLIVNKYIYSFFQIFNFPESIHTILTIAGSIGIFGILMILVGVLPKDEIYKILGIQSFMEK